MLNLFILDLLAINSPFLEPLKWIRVQLRFLCPPRAAPREKSGRVNETLLERRKFVRANVYTYINWLYMSYMYELIQRTRFGNSNRINATYRRTNAQFIQWTRYFFDRRFCQSNSSFSQCRHSKIGSPCDIRVRIKWKAKIWN